MFQKLFATVFVAGLLGPTVGHAQNFKLDCSLTRFFMSTDYPESLTRGYFFDKISFDFKDGTVTSGDIRGKVIRDTDTDLLWNYVLVDNRGNKAHFQGQFNKATNAYRAAHIAEANFLPLGNARGACARRK